MYATKSKISITDPFFINGAKNSHINEQINIKTNDVVPIKTLLYLYNRIFEYESNNIGAKTSL